MTLERRHNVIDQTFPDIQTDHTQRGIYSFLATQAGDKVAVAALAPDAAQTELDRFTDEVDRSIDTGEIVLPIRDGVDQGQIKKELIVELFRAADELAQNETIDALQQRVERQQGELTVLREVLLSDEGVNARELLRIRAELTALIAENAQLKIQIEKRDDIIAHRDVEKIRRQTLRVKITGRKVVSIVKGGIADIFKHEPLDITQPFVIK